MKEPFYHSTIKRLVALFGSMFDEVYYIDGFGKKQKVPLFYGPREKWLVDRLEASDLYRLNAEQVWPRMGFEMTGMNFAPERNLNTMHKIRAYDTGKWQYNRVPYDFSFNLFIAAKQLEPSLKIIEQVVPIFAPAMNLTVNEVDGFGTETDISVVLDSVGYDIEYQGSLADPRTIVWTLGFTMKAYLYQRNNIQQLIKETITKMSTSDMDSVFTKLTSEVVPREANKWEPHEIIDKVEEVNQ